MKVDVRHSGDVIIVDLRGGLVAGVGDEMLREVMNALVAEGWKGILLNLSGVPRIDSAGIGELVASVRMANRLGSRTKLLHVIGRVRDVLELSQVLPLLDVHDSEQEALAAFAGDPALGIDVGTEEAADGAASDA
ncbi:MAG: STAS domain-containing protein [Acidobacteriota bacterium]